MFLRRHVWLLGVWRSGLRLRAPAVGVMDALVIPADPKEPVRVIDLHAGDDEVGNLQREVGGVFDVVAHRECDFWINDEGRINDSPVYVRASHWVLRESAMAKEGRVWEGAILYGDCVVTGPPLGGEATEIDPALVGYFKGLELSKDAVADWDVRNVRWRVTEWPDIDRNRGDDGYGLGF